MDIVRPVFNIDRTANKHGTIDNVCHLLVMQGNKKQRVPFYVTNLGTDRFILGYPWCQEFKPDIDWSNSMLKGPKIKMETLLHGKLEHLWQFAKKQHDNKEHNNLIFTISATDTPETPEEALARLEEQLRDEDQGSSWSGGTSLEEEGQVMIRRTQNTVEMAHEYAKTHAKAEVVLPEAFKRHAALFSDEEAKTFPPKRAHDHKIELTDAAPAQFNMKMYPLSAKEQAAKDKFLDKNLEKGYIKPSDSPYGFSTFMVPKKDSDEMRYIIDYRPLNAVTKRDITPLPNLSQCIEDLQGMEVFSKFDVRWGYNNIQIREEDQWKTAFKTRRGLYECLVMFFGMSNSPAAFQRFMNHALEPWYKKHGHKNGKNYMDDIGIGTKLKDLDKHIEMIHDLFDILAEHGLHLKLSKSIFMQPQMDFLRVRISKDGVTIDPAKVAGITEWPEECKTVKQVRAVLGVMGYHRMHIPRFSTIAAPLTKLTGKDVPFEWTEECRQAVYDLKKAVTTAPVLVRPDTKKQFELEVEASEIATGAILYQRDKPVKLPSGKEKPGPRRPVGFHSQKFTATERNYLIYNREFLAIMRGLHNWSHLLKGTEIPVLVYTDHANLRYYRDPRKIGPRVACRGRSPRHHIHKQSHAQVQRCPP